VLRDWGRMVNSFVIGIGFVVRRKNHTNLGDATSLENVQPHVPVE